MIAIEAVVPKDIAQVPIAKIVEIRNNHKDNLIAFRAHLEGLGEHLKTLDTIHDPQALRLQLDAYYHDNLARDLARLKEGMTKAKVDTVMTAMNTQIALPTAVSDSTELLHASINPVVAGGTALAFGMVKVLRARREQQTKLEASPAAYLLRLEEGLQPATLLERIRRRVRRFLTGF